MIVQHHLQPLPLPAAPIWTRNGTAGMHVLDLEKAFVPPPKLKY